MNTIVDAIYPPAPVGSSWAGVGVPLYPLFPRPAIMPFMAVYRIQEGAALYSLTFTVVYWLPVFVSEEPCLILTESLNFCHQHKFLRVNAFIIMPTHAHLVVFDADYDSSGRPVGIRWQYGQRDFGGRR